MNVCVCVTVCVICQPESLSVCASIVSHVRAADAAVTPMVTERSFKALLEPMNHGANIAADSARPRKMEGEDDGGSGEKHPLPSQTEEQLCKA